ncbi:MAG: hypothetical protein ACREDZ_09535 [Kiloniellales bacterium]
MYRSVQTSQQTNEGRKKHVHWAEGVGIGVVVFVLVFIVFGWLSQL